MVADVEYVAVSVIDCVRVIVLEGLPFPLSQWLKRYSP
jgi:hypothetical protein